MDSPTDENSRLSNGGQDEEEDLSTASLGLKEDDDDDGDDDEEDVDDDDEEDVDDDDDDVDEDDEDDSFKTPSSTPLRSGSPNIIEEDIDRMLTPVRKRGRPSKADLLRRQATGDYEDLPTPKKRGRKPMPKEEKERLKEEKKEKKRQEQIEKRKGEARKKPGRKSVVLSAEEKEKREKARKAKYEEFKKAKAEKAAKRAERNEQLRLIRKQKKEDEVRQREAYEKRMQELKASFLDENTQMSSGGGAGDFVDGLQDETSQSSISSFKKGFINEMSYIDRVRNVTAETLLEYRWPLEGKNSEYYFLQEQVCEYLGLKSFKRRYPDVARRKIDFEERDFLVEMKIVSEMQADLGLTAIPSSEVLDIMSRDFYEKYDEYMNVISERKDRNIRQMAYNTVTVEKHHLADFVERAVQSTAEWNKKMNKERSENRKAYFDLQTFSIHYPMNNRGRMRVIPKPKLGHYPISIIPGQFTDYFRKYTSSQLKYMPLNSTLAGPPQSGTRVDFIDSPPELDVSESSDCSTCSDSSSSDSENDEDQGQEKSPPPPSLKRNDIDKPGARCKDCQGDRMKNKVGVPENLLHCSKCDLSAHPTCIGLSLEHVPFVTNYEWECTECKKCIKCKDHTDEEKMLFCDLCDRGFHIYCVGLDEVPVGRWHCSDCSYCFSCGAKEPDGGEVDINNPKWVVEYKPGVSSRVFSHTLCSPCHKLTKKGQFCPECSKVFGREEFFSENSGDQSFSKDLVSCWVCSRQHHSNCVGQSLFICSGCQRRTKEKSIGSDGYFLSNLNKPEKNEKSPRVKPNRSMSNNVSISHICDTCGKMYKNKASLYSHKHRDHGLKITLIK